MKDDLIPPLPPAKDIRERPARARYDKVKANLDLKWRRRDPQIERMMRETVDGLSEAFIGAPWIWCGVWILQPDGKAFQPGPARPSPAPEAIPAEGPIAEALTGAPAKPGAKSVFVPLLDKNGRVWAVFEARSENEFDEMDARWVERLFKPLQFVERPDRGV